MDLEELRERARDYVLRASVAELEAFLANDHSLVEKLLDGDEATTFFVTRLPVEIAVQLLDHMSLNDAMNLCRLNSAFKKWCDQVGFIDEIRKGDENTPNA